MLQGTKYQLEHANLWSRKKKNLSYYVNELIKLMYSQAGISPTIKPGLNQLPTLTLTQTEYSHLFLNHILPRASECVVNSFHSYSSNETIQQLLYKSFAKVTDSSFRPSDCAKSNLRDCSENTQAALKSLHTYRSAFELAVHGQTLGFGTLQLSFLQRFIEWNGKFLCDTLDDTLVNHLINEAHKISILVHESPLMTAFTESTPCLRTWLNMVDFCLYWCQNANVFNGLHFESGNKITKNDLEHGSNVPADVKLKNHTTRNRMLKDINAQAMNAHCNTNIYNQRVDDVPYLNDGDDNDDDDNQHIHQININMHNGNVIHDNQNQHDDDDDYKHGLGSGIYTVLNNLTKSVLPIKKLFMYQCQLEADGIRFIKKTKSNYKYPFILHSVPRVVLPRAWTNMINYSNGILFKLSVEGIKAYLISKWFKLLIKCVIISQSTQDQDWQIVQKFIEALRQEVVQLFVLKGISTYYRAWNDSVIRKNDTIYTRHENEPDGLYLVELLLKIDGLHQFAQDERYTLNQSFEDSYESIIIACCLEWHPRDSGNNENQFNYETFDFHSVPVIQLSQIKKIVNVKNIVQQCYVAHDHVIPCLEDQRGVNNMINAWSMDDDDCNWVMNRNIHLQENENHILSYCGVGWKCRDHDTVNCNECLNRGNHCNKGDIVYDCVEEEYPYFKAFTIYQGYVNRFFNCRCINELGW